MNKTELYLRVVTYEWQWCQVYIQRERLWSCQARGSTREFNTCNIVNRVCTGNFRGIFSLGKIAILPVILPITPVSSKLFAKSKVAMAILLFLMLRSVNNKNCHSTRKASHFADTITPSIKSKRVSIVTVSTSRLLYGLRIKRKRTKKE